MNNRFNEIYDLLIQTRCKVQTWSGSILVPLWQNILGGLSAGILAYIYLVTDILTFAQPEFIIALKLAIVIAAIFNVIKFLSDELKILVLAFMLGQLFGTREKTLTSINNGTIVKTKDAAANALKLIIAYYDANIPITQNNASLRLKLNRKEYEEARSILINSALLKNSRATTLTPMNKTDALALFNEWKKNN